MREEKLSAGKKYLLLSKRGVPSQAGLNNQIQARVSQQRTAKHGAWLEQEADLA